MRSRLSHSRPFLSFSHVTFAVALATAACSSDPTAIRLDDGGDGVDAQQLPDTSARPVGDTTTVAGDGRVTQPQQDAGADVPTADSALALDAYAAQDTKPSGIDASRADSALPDAARADTALPDAAPIDAVAPPVSGNFPARFAAPYVEVWNDHDLEKLANTTGHKFYTLAFVINGTSKCNPMLNGDTALTASNYRTYITKLRALGGDVIVSFGGAAGTELGQSCDTVATLQAAYQKVIDTYGLTWIDLDIESGAQSDTASVDRRNKAIHNLQVANPALRVSYTLGVDRTGLPSAQLNLLKNAKANSARVDVVNIMAMDYGPCYNDMGQAAIDAAKATGAQLTANGISAKVGVTPMIGVNDVACEVFSLADAQLLVDGASSDASIALLAFWVVGADANHSYLNTFHAFK